MTYNVLSGTLSLYTTTQSGIHCLIICTSAVDSEQFRQT